MRRKDKVFLCVLALFFVFLFFSSINNSSNEPDIPADKDSNQNGIKIDLTPKTSGNEINITTPENITYHEPMDGYYLGSHGYEDIQDGSLPSDYIYSIGGSSRAGVISNKTDIAGNRHNKVIELDDSSSSSTARIDAYYLESGSSDARNATIESYNLVIKDSSGLNPAIFSYFGIMGDIGWIARLRWYKWSDLPNSDRCDIEYYDGISRIDSGIDQKFDQWYRYSIDISSDGGYAGLGANEWRFRVYDELDTLIYTSGILDFYTDHPTGGSCLYRMASTGTSVQQTRTYLDALSITGLKDNYQIGDNKKEGLLLSFKNSTTLHRIRYSLDGQTNKTILGNTTIPFPEEGLHTIQIFGNDTLGSNFQSEIKHFTVELLRINWSTITLEGIRIGSIITDEANPRTKYSSFVSDLVIRGVVISDISISTVITQELLTNYEIIWIDEGWRSMTEAERNNIKQWVSEGGSLIITGDLYGASKGLLSTQFDLESGNTPWGAFLSDNIYPHPITQNVTTIRFPSLGGIITTISHPDATLCTIANGRYTVVALDHGKGSVVVAPDEIAQDLGSYDNHLFLNNTFGWLGYWKNNHTPTLLNLNVNPKVGNQLTKFNFSVEYVDLDNDAPFYINITINETSYEMEPVNPLDTDYTDGAVYQYITYVVPASHNYTYYVNVSDRRFINSSIIKDDLEVNVQNNFSPELQNPHVNPEFGLNSTLYNFTVMYFDTDNNLPSNINITINTTTYLMSIVNPSDNNATDGILYYYNSTLDFGYYKFQINCSDSLYENATNWIFAPEVNPFYGQIIELLTPYNNTEFFTGWVNFTWTSLELAYIETNYTLQISNMTNFSYIIFEKTDIQEKSQKTNLSIYVDFQSDKYYWRVKPTSGIFEGQWSNYSIFNLTFNENKPILEDYSVDPMSGDQFTKFNFSVAYFDLDNNPPFYINITINGTSYEMEPVNPLDADYTDGCFYQYLTHLNPSIHNYTYYFICYDGKFTNSTDVFDNLNVTESNFFEPRLLNPIVTPEIGNHTTLYNFTVWYFDDDNNFPLYVNITINKTVFSMVQANLLDINATDGIKFYYNSTLDFGYYEFQINCSDFLFSNTTEWIVAPEVNPFYKYGKVTLFGPENSTTFFTGVINFTWYSLEAQFGAVNYTIQISNSSEIIYTLDSIEERVSISNLTIYYDFPTDQYFWRIRATYEIFSGNWSNFWTFNLTLNHFSPTLFSGSVNPKIGDYLTEFNFTIEYFDNDNNSPSFINVSINGTSYRMNKVDPSDINFIDGCLYYYTIYLPPSIYNYTYYFNCSDGKYSSTTIIYDDLKVIESSHFKPRLLNPSFTPNSGYKFTIFNFSVWYFDDDNNLPLYVNMSIDRAIFSMAQENPQDKNAVDGIKFYYNSTLKHRNSQFQINCSDGFNTSSTNWINYPTLNFIEKEAYAIVIGIEFYPGPGNDLYYTVDDAISMYYFLNEDCNVKDENIIFLYDNYATKDDIDDAFTQIRSQIGTYDTFFFYFSGHGGTDGFEYICPYDSLPASPSNLYYWDDLRNQVDSLGCAEKYIIIDACNSGGMIVGPLANKFYMTACDDDEESLEVPALQHGLFTYNFLGSLNSAPDINGDGVLSMEEQFPYIYLETVSYSTGEGAVHHPQQYDGITGETVLSPSFGSKEISSLKDELNFSFYLYGNGRVDKIELTIYAGSVIRSFDLYYATSSITGFGYYNGAIDLEDNLVITGYKLIAEIQGDKKIILGESQGGAVYASDVGDGPSGDSAEDYSSILISIAIVATVVGGLTLTGIVIYKKKMASKTVTLMKSVVNKPTTSQAAEFSTQASVPFMVKYCTNCGAPYKIGQMFCTICGKSQK